MSYEHLEPRALSGNVSSLLSPTPFCPPALTDRGAYVQEIGFVIPILLMRKQRLREVK